MRRVATLDGLRGIAILLVMTIHYFVFEPWHLLDRVLVKAAGFGWVGVDLFFVLSGFLITGILVDAKTGQSELWPYLQRFLVRRVLRIFPLYFLFVFGLAIASWVIASNEFFAVQSWYWTYTVNFLIADRAVWSAAPLNSGHLWSLAIEEQFYLVWPFIVWAVSTKTLLRTCFAIVLGALALRAALRFADVSTLAIFVMTPTRIDTLAMGAAAACLVRLVDTAQLLVLGRRALVFGGVALLCVMLFERSTNQYGFAMQTVGYTAISLLSVGVIVFALHAPARALLHRVLAARLLVFFGTYSYALYIVHGFVFHAVDRVFPRINSLPPLAGFLWPWALLKAVLAGVVSVGLALASWHLIEKKCLALKDKIAHEPRASIGGSESQA
jgi:peptidoglycan/LPS O-acetylase OafA/YrhL